MRTDHLTISHRTFINLHLQGYDVCASQFAADHTVNEN